MTRPPDEVVNNPDKPTKSAIINDNIINNKKRLFDIWLGLVIFIASGIELVSWFMPQNKDYLLFWYPLLNNITLLAFSSFFIIKAFRYKSCIYTKIASIGYALVNVISFIFIVVPGTSSTLMLQYAYPVIVTCVILSLLILFIKWLFEK